MSSFDQFIAQRESESRWANVQVCISIGVAALLSYAVIHFCYVHSYFAVLLMSSCAAITSISMIGLAVITGFIRTDDNRFYYLTYLPVLTGFSLGLLFGFGLLFTQLSQPDWLLAAITIFSGPLIAFVLWIACEVVVRTCIRIFERATGIQTYKAMVNMMAYDDLGAAIFYAFPTFLMWSSIAGFAVGGLVLL